jgi:hypothetical protein
MRALLLLSAAAVVPAAPVTPWVHLGDGTKMPAISLGTCCGSKPKIGVGPWVAAGGIGIDTSECVRPHPRLRRPLGLFAAGPPLW